jgi:pimeloyl-ACP methyl ester carboxylesterase
MRRSAHAGGALHLTDEGQGPTVLLLHGQPGTLAEMVPIAEALGGTVRVLNVDRPGYGRTGGRGRSFVEQADLFAGVLRARGAAPAVVVGYSLGGGVALTLALRHPSVVSGLVLISSIGGAGSVTFGDSVLAAPILGPPASVVTLLGFGLVLPRLARLWKSPTVRANALSAPATIPVAEVQAFVDEQRHLMADHRALSEQLSFIRCPAVVIIGGRDLIVSPEAGWDLAERLGAEAVELGDLGHLIPRDAPDVVATATLRLLERIGSLGSPP